MDTLTQDVLNEITFGDARGGRKPAGGFDATVVRGLRPDDVEAVVAGAAAPTTQLQRIRQSHHALAKALAGGATGVEAAAITGYSPMRISLLRADPTFQELLAGYESEAQTIFTDYVERCKTLGLSAVDELLHRLEEAPDQFARRELMELVELTLAKVPNARAQAEAPRQGPPVFNMVFVPGQQAPREVTGEIIDALPAQLDSPEDD